MSSSCYVSSFAFDVYWVVCQQVTNKTEKSKRTTCFLLLFMVLHLFLLFNNSLYNAIIHISEFVALFFLFSLSYWKSKEEKLTEKKQQIEIYLWYRPCRC